LYKKRAYIYLLEMREIYECDAKAERATPHLRVVFGA